MLVIQSAIDGVDIVPSDAVEFDPPLPPEALPFTLGIRNGTDRAIPLVGVRFDMRGPKGESYSVVHYADMLRDPASAELVPGSVRAICAEPSYTARKPDVRGRMNLDNLKRMLSIRGSLDCIAFADGRFEGPDSRGALERMNRGRLAEERLIAEVLAAREPRAALTRAAADTKSDQARVALARRLLSLSGDVIAAAHSHRYRIPLWRA